MNNDLRDAKSLFESGLQHLQQKDFYLAEQYFRQSLELAPDRESILTNLSTTLMLQEKWNESERITERLLKINSRSYEGYINLATILSHLGKTEIALKTIDEAIKINQNNYQGWCNKGNILLDLFDPKEALLCFDKAIALNPLSVESLIGRANAKNHFKRYKEALSDLEQAIEIDPSNHKAKFNKGLSLIRLGEFKEGWELFEHRFYVPGTKENEKYAQIKKWGKNESLANKSLLIHSEQGFGDSIQFSRYLPLLQDQNPTTSITLVTPPPLEALMKRLHPKIKVTPYEKVADYRHFDYKLPIMSLPNIFETTLKNIPINIPYVSIDEQLVANWGQYLKNISKHHYINSTTEKKFRIGLCWEGSGKYATQTNPRRNVDFFLIAKLMDELGCQLTNIEFHSLQLGPSSSIPSRPYSHSNRLHNFHETGALIKNLDLIISIDTAVAHLSGALGAPTLLMLPDPPDFLSMAEGNTHYWYPNTKLFRQLEPNNWSHPIEEIKKSVIQYYLLQNKKPTA